MMRTLVLALALLAACKDESHDTTGDSSSSSGVPNFTDCTDCPVGGPVVCPEGQVCASIVPGSGGVCMLACNVDDPSQCVVNGIVAGTCKIFPSDIAACNNSDNGPVCPPG